MKKYSENKIVFVIPDMPGGGTERVIALLANEYAKRGMEVAILLFAGNQRDYPLDERIEVITVGNASGGSMLVRFERIRKMRQYYKQNRNCRIWSFSVMGAVFSVAATLGMRKGYEFLVSERNDPNRYEHPYLRNFCYRFADVLVCQTKDAIASFPKGIQKKAIMIPNPVAIGELQPYEGEREKKIVAVGRLEPQKNHRLLLQAFAAFQKEHTPYRLDIYGKGELEEALKKEAEKLNIDTCVNFKGFCAQVKEKINSAAMFVLSSDYEGVSNSMLEAIALGVPVVATDCPIGGTKAYIEDGKNGLLVPVGDAEALTAAMAKIADNKELAGQISLEGRKLRERNRIEQIADDFLEAKYKVLKKTGRN